MNKNIKHIPKYLLTWLFGGNWKYGWNPSLLGKVKKFYKESWRDSKYSLFGFIKPEIGNWINIK